MAETVVIKDDRKKYDRILREVAQLRRMSVTIGVHSDASERNDDLTNPQLAAIHEFGTSRIPERSFLRATVDTDRSIEQFAREQAAEVASGQRDAAQAGERIGIIATAAVKKRIRSHIPPPLAAITIQRKLEKGSHGGGLASKANDPAAPLIDTGQLINSITYKVNK